MSDTSKSKPRWGVWDSVLTLLGAAIGILSISSLTQYWTHVTLSDDAGGLLASYRGLANQTKWIMFDWWTGITWPDWSVPSWVMDMLALWSVSYAEIVRGNSVSEIGRYQTSAPNDHHLLSRGMRILIEMTFAPLVFFHYVFRRIQKLISLKRDVHTAQTEGHKTMTASTLRAVFISCFVPAGVGFFFLWNMLSI